MRNTSSKAQVGRQHQREPERQHGDEIDEAGRAQRIFQARAHGAQMPVRPVLDRAPQPQAIFDREHDQREIFDQVEGQRIARAVVRHRFQRDRDQIDQDERDQQPVDDDAHAAAHRALLEDQIEAPPHLFKLARHAVSAPLESK